MTTHDYTDCPACTTVLVLRMSVMIFSFIPLILSPNTVVRDHGYASTILSPEKAPDISIELEHQLIWSWLTWYNPMPVVLQ